MNENKKWWKYRNREYIIWKINLSKNFKIIINYPENKVHPDYKS